MRRPLLALVLCAAPSAAVAQSSQLSVSGLGLPGRGFSVHAVATGGSFALFDGESSLNPAALSGITTLTALFTGTQDFRQVKNPGGDASTRDVRFPQFAVANSLRGTLVAVGVSYSSYTIRDFTFGLKDTVDLRGLPVEVGDTFSSRGGLSDIRLGAAYRFGATWAAGAGFHIITGSNRLDVRRGFSDAAYLPTRQQSEVGYSGVGLSLGILGELGPGIVVAAMARVDGHLDVERDSANAGTIDLPYSFASGLWWRTTPQLSISGQVIARTWSAANSDLLARGEPGSKNTLEMALGTEFTPDPRRPYRRPLRLGVRYASLPFLLYTTPEQPREFGISLGTGTRFAAQRAGIDLALERLWRSAGDYSEGSWVLSVGVSVRP